MSDIATFTIADEVWEQWEPIIAPNCFVSHWPQHGTHRCGITKSVLAAVLEEAGRRFSTDSQLVTFTVEYDERDNARVIGHTEQLV